MADELDTTPIQSLYAERFAADLETNRKEQEDLSSRITELEARLKQLKADEDWLCGAQGAVPPAGFLAGGSSAAVTAVPLPATEEAPATRAVPKPRQAKKASATAPRAKKAAPAKKPSGGATATKTRTAPATKVKPAPATAPKTAAVAAAPAKTTEAAAAPAKATPAKTAPEAAAPASAVKSAPATTSKAAPVKASKAAPVKAEKAAPATEKQAAPKAVKVAEPPLRELVLALLTGAAEPRMVSEVSTELTAAHPSRSTSTQVVRNTLEGLAKKGLIEKDNKQGSVMYTAPRPGTDRPAPEVPKAEKSADATAPSGA
ncbi:hypothetical protein AB0D46_37570 [Streptomyces sp. NPDC048383]|uniref:hypothetical protein n=1 Tax=Streptomyces sp. NPDC048383 TaxID=3155386 RepID=UPI00343C5F75